MTTQPDFERARRKPAYRQKFLDALDLGDLRTRTRSIIYGDVSDTLSQRRDNLVEDDEFAATLYPPRFGDEPGMKPCIRVFSKFFDGQRILTLDDALSALYDHEGTHVRQHEENMHMDIAKMLLYINLADVLRRGTQTRLKIQKYKEITLDIASDIIEAKIETPAYQAQVDNFAYRQVSDTFRKMIVDSLSSLRDLTTTIDDATSGAASAMTRQTMTSCLDRIDEVSDMQSIMERYTSRMVEMTRGNGYSAGRAVD